MILVLSSTPRPLFLQSAGVPHVSFPPYTRKEAITIITASGPPSVDGLPTDIASKLYPHFVSTVYDSLVGPTAGTIPSFRSICERLWPPFVAPVVNERNKEWDFSRLLVRNRALFRQQGEAVLVHRIVPEESTTSTATLTNNYTPSSSTTTPTPAPSSSPLPSLPYFPTLVLTSAYLASHTPPRLDTIFFSKFSSSSLSARNKRSHHRRRLKLLSQAQAAEDRLAEENGASPTKKKGKRQKTRITKSTLESAFATTTAGGPPAGTNTGPPGTATILAARPFPVERLIAIYRAIDPNPPANPIRAAAVADAVYAELATLRRLRLVVPASTGTGTGGGGAGMGFGGGGGNVTADAGEKWCVNVSREWIEEMAKGIGVEVGDWLAGGLD